MEFWTNLGPIAQGLIALIVAVVVFVGGLKWRDLLSKSPDAKVSQLSEWLDIAIATAYRTSDQALNEFGHTLDGADRKAVAEVFYNYLPSYVRGKVTKEEWAVYVQDRYEVLLERWWGARDKFGKLAEEALREKGIVK